MHYLIVLVALLIGSRVVDECTYLLAAENGRLEVLGEQGGVVIELQVAGVAILLDCDQGIW